MYVHRCGRVIQISLMYKWTNFFSIISGMYVGVTASGDRLCGVNCILYVCNGGWDKPHHALWVVLPLASKLDNSSPKQLSRLRALVTIRGTCYYLGHLLLSGRLVTIWGTGYYLGHLLLSGALVTIQGTCYYLGHLLLSEVLVTIWGTCYYLEHLILFGALVTIWHTCYYLGQLSQAGGLITTWRVYLLLPGVFAMRMHALLLLGHWRLCVSTNEVSVIYTVNSLDRSTQTHFSEEDTISSNAPNVQSIC